MTVAMFSSERFGARMGVAYFFFGSAVHVPAPQLAWPIPALFCMRPLAVAVGAAMSSAGADATGGVADAEAPGVDDFA
jgi:hypothetical protein